jgi:nicotinamidase/pyrazinamidase
MSHAMKFPNGKKKTAIKKTGFRMTKDEMTKAAEIASKIDNPFPLMPRRNSSLSLSLKKKASEKPPYVDIISNVGDGGTTNHSKTRSSIAEGRKSVLERFSSELQNNYLMIILFSAVLMIASIYFWFCHLKNKKGATTTTTKTTTTTTTTTANRQCAPVSFNSSSVDTPSFNSSLSNPSVENIINSLPETQKVNQKSEVKTGHYSTKQQRKRKPFGEVDRKSALIVVDFQVCFSDSSLGSLPIKGVDAIAEIINRTSKLFDFVVATKLAFPPNHVSFASQHKNEKPFDVVSTDEWGMQILWPAHCIQGTEEAQLHPFLDIPHVALILNRGFRRESVPRSAFKNADNKSTGLAELLRSQNIDTVFVCGLIYDFAVGNTAIDAKEGDFDCFLLDDATIAINVGGTRDKMKETLALAGVQFINSDSLFKSQS